MVTVAMIIIATKYYMKNVDCVIFFNDIWKINDAQSNTFWDMRV